MSFESFVGALPLRVGKTVHVAVISAFTIFARDRRRGLMISGSPLSGSRTIRVADTTAGRTSVEPNGGPRFPIRARATPRVGGVFPRPTRRRRAGGWRRRREASDARGTATSPQPPVAGNPGAPDPWIARGLAGSRRAVGAADLGTSRLSPGRAISVGLRVVDLSAAALDKAPTSRSRGRRTRVSDSRRVMAYEARFDPARAEEVGRSVPASGLALRSNWPTATPRSRLRFDSRRR